MKHEGKQVRFQFLSVLSHELKAPLTAVEGYLTMIKERQLGNTLEDYDEAIERSLKRLQGMRNLILNLLDLTKLNPESQVKKNSNTNLVEIIKTSIDTMMPFAIQKDVKITLQAPEKVVKYLDPEEMEIIFNNLISNAIKYNKTGGTIEINLIEESGKPLLRLKIVALALTKKICESFSKILCE